MKIIKLIPLVVAIVISSWTQAESSITGILLDQHGEPISDAEIFINDAHVSKSNEKGYFNINLNEDIKKVTIRSFSFYAHNIKADFTQKNIDLGELYLIPRVIWTNKSINTHFDSYSGGDEFKKKRFKSMLKNSDKRYSRWVPHGRSKYYNQAGKLITTLKFKKGKLIYSKRNHNKNCNKLAVNINEKFEVMLDLTSE